jgi:hypothetical protein
MTRIVGWDIPIHVLTDVIEIKPLILKVACHQSRISHHSAKIGCFIFWEICLPINLKTIVIAARHHPPLFVSARERQAQSLPLESRR